MLFIYEEQGLAEVIAEILVKTDYCVYGQSLEMICGFSNLMQGKQKPLYSVNKKVKKKGY